MSRGNSIAATAARIVGNLLAPPPTGRRWPRAVELAAFFAGAMAAIAVLPLPDLLHDVQVPFQLLAAALGTGLVVLAHAERPVRGRAWVRGSARALLLAGYAVAAYLAILLAALLGWSTEPWARAGIALAGLLSVASAIPRRAPVRIPALLPLGLCIAACHVGWYRDDGLIRCDDYLAVRDDPRVELVVATTPALEACRPGDRLHVSRYPRKVWEAPDGGRMIVTTQEGDPASAAAGRDVPARFDGPVCETWPDPARAPHCLGRGKAHHIVDAPALDGLYVTTWRMPDQGAASTTYELSRTEPMTVLFERTYPDTVGPGWYDPRAGVFEGLDDVGLEILTMRPSDLEIVARREMPAGNSDQWHYDADREEGLLCLALLWTRPIDGEAYLAVAFHGSPPEFRPLGGSGANPLAWVSGVWGCDWDPEARRAWIAVTNLGMIATVDYDTGAVLRWTWVGLGGMRQVAYDRQRRRLFVANFHGGRVTALDPETGDEVAHWFAGRFVRDLALARDGRSLLVTSNLGVLRIRLDD